MSYPIKLGYNTNGEFYIQLPQGASSDSNNIYLFVKIVDNLECVSIFSINSTVVVADNKNSVTSIANEVLNYSVSTDLLKLSTFAQDIYSGDTKFVTKSVILLTTILNKDNSNQVSYQLKIENYNFYNFFI